MVKSSISLVPELPIRNIVVLSYLSRVWRAPPQSPRWHLESDPPPAGFHSRTTCWRTSPGRCTGRGDARPRSRPLAAADRLCPGSLGITHSSFFPFERPREHQSMVNNCVMGRICTKEVLGLTYKNPHCAVFFGGC